MPFPASAMIDSGRGYDVPLDPKIPRLFSSTTFLFAPCLSNLVLVPVMLALKPMLYLGVDFARLMTSRFLVGFFLCLDNG